MTDKAFPFIMSGEPASVDADISPPLQVVTKHPADVAESGDSRFRRQTRRLHTVRNNVQAAKVTRAFAALSLCAATASMVLGDLASTACSRHRCGRIFRDSSQEAMRA